MAYLHMKSWVNRKPQPNRVEIKIPSIHESRINHLYSAIDWFIKNNRTIKSDTSTMLLTLKDEINTKEFNQDFMENYPSQSTNTIEFEQEEFTFSKQSENITVNTMNGEIKKTNMVITIWSLYSTKEKLKKLCKYIAQQYALDKSQKVWIQKVYTHNNNGWTFKEMKKNKRKIETVVLLGNKNIKMKEDLTHFSNTEPWHLEHGIPYKKSYLFYGPPGTGKISMIKAISYEFQRHIHYLSLNTIKNDTELNSLMGQIDMNKTIVVIEDIDAMTEAVHKRKKEKKVRKIKKTKKIKTKFNNGGSNSDGDNDSGDDSDLSLDDSDTKSSSSSSSSDNDSNNKNNNNNNNNCNNNNNNGNNNNNNGNNNNNNGNNGNNNNGNNNGNNNHQGITLSGLLNAIDGVHDNHGMILTITSNMPEKLDPALLREGRVDDKIYFGFCSNDEIFIMMKNFYNGKFITKKKDFDSLKFPDHIAPCRVENLMKKHWETPQKVIDDLLSGKKTKLTKFDY